MKTHDRGETLQSSPALRNVSGRDYAEWFALLDALGTTTRSYGEVSAWLQDQGLSKWWAQKLIVEYEQLRGIRSAGARRDGTFTGGASKTIHAPFQHVFDAVADPARRRQWLSDVEVTQRSATAPGKIRFDVADGSRLSFDVAEKGAGRCLIAVEQARLSSSDAAASAKDDWRRRLSVLKNFVEGH